MVFIYDIYLQNFQLLLWDKAETELARLALRFSQLYYDNLLRVSAKLLVIYLKGFYCPRYN